MKQTIAFVIALLLFVSQSRAQQLNQDSVTTPPQPQGQQGWIQVNSGFPSGINFISFPSKDTAYAIGTTAVLRSIDGGSTWHQLSAPTGAAGDFFDALHGYVQGVNRTCYHTSDGGMNWIATNDSSIPGALYAITQDTAIIAGDAFFRTSDGGKSWHNLSPAYGGSITFYDNQHGFLVRGRSAYIYYDSTADAGYTWQTLSSFRASGQSKLTPVYISIDTILVLGDIGFARRSTDGGIDWDTVGKSTIPTGYGFGAVAYRSGRLLAVGTSGAIITSLDYGLTWEKENSGVGTELSTIKMFDNNLALAGGVNGTIVKTTNGGVDWIQVSPPSSSDLQSQVFPQPASRTLNISYTLPQLQGVTISVYDLTGKTIATPALKQLQTAGPHVIPFDGSQYPAGVYSYSIQTERYRASGKFTLVK
jgi:photosystem II stability/assembly factor-like uncharacterized protein